MTDHDEHSLALHRAARGKIEIKCKVPLGTKTDLSLAYTPGVAAVSRAIAENKSLTDLLTWRGGLVAVISDGSAVLGLGNIGPEAALPVLEGKAALLKVFGGVDAVPLVLATQDTEEIIAAVKVIAPSFGGINLEDIAAPRCFEVERRLLKELPIPVMHDDQHGTAAVVLAGLINALQVRGLDRETARVVLSGAGAAGTAIAKILADYDFRKIILRDSRGVMSRSRTDLNEEKLALILYLEEHAGGYDDTGDDGITGRDIFIGVSKGGALTAEQLRTMNKRPVIFALANPRPEIMPAAAKAAGAAIVATGRSDFPNQVNNVLAFPGLFRGALKSKIKRFTPEMFVRAAERLAACVGEPTAERILPDPLDPKVVEAVADAISA